MGAFYLFHNRINKQKAKVLEILEKRGFSSSIERQFNDFTLILFNKVLINNKKYIEIENDFLCYCGTMIYRGLDEGKSLKRLYYDIKHSSIDEEHLIGHFICIGNIDNKITLITDKLCTLPVYYREDCLALSSSMVALSYSGIENLSISNQAMLENILVRGVVPPDTQFNEIKRWIPSLGIIKIGSINIYTYKLLEYYDHNISYDHAVKEQINRLDEYIDQIKQLISANGVQLGISSGFDTRLLLAMLLRHRIKPECFTYWGYGITKDYQIAHQISNKMDLNLATVKEHKLLPDELGKENNSYFSEGFLFTDGQIRSENFWDEIYNTTRYYKLLALSSTLVLDGIGGEQYRNAEGFNNRTISLNQWIQQNVLHNSNIIINNKIRAEFVSRYIEKVQRILNIKDTIDGFGIKKYYNEVYGYANRHFRSIFGNQVFYHLSPFADYFNSLYAYRAVPHLGSLYRFQMDMINKINPMLAGIDSQYGFSFNKNIPIYHFLKLNVKNRLSRKTQSKIKHVLQKLRMKELENNDNYLYLKNKLDIDVSYFSRDREKMQLIKQIIYFYNWVGNSRGINI